MRVLSPIVLTPRPVWGPVAGERLIGTTRKEHRKGTKSMGVYLRADGESRVSARLGGRVKRCLGQRHPLLPIEERRRERANAA